MQGILDLLTISFFVRPAKVHPITRLCGSRNAVCRSKVLGTRMAERPPFGTSSPTLGGPLRRVIKRSFLAITYQMIGISRAIPGVGSLSIQFARRNSIGCIHVEGLSISYPPTCHSTNRIEIVEEETIFNSPGENYDGSKDLLP